MTPPADPALRRSAGDLIASLSLSYITGALVLGFLIYSGGVWNFLANTRLLDLLSRGGIVALTDADAGFFTGVPDLSLYVAARDPIDIGLVFLAMGIFLVFWGLKAYQFHDFTRFCGIDGTLGQDARIYLYGSGMNRLLPYNLGNAAVAAALQNRGASLESASMVVFLGEMFVALEIAVFAFIGLWVVGWTTWLSTMFWAMIIAGVAYSLMRPRFGIPGRFRRWRGARSGQEAVEKPESEFLLPGRQVLRVLAQKPLVLLRLAVVSFLAFGLEDIAAYAIAQAFTSTHVILNADTSLILMAVVASYLARYFPFTPGGIGQFEWAFAAALYLGGIGLPEAVTIAVLDNVIRYVTGTLLLGGVMLGKGVDTSMRSALALSGHTAGEPQAAG